MIEEFKPIKGFDKYYVSNLGKILNAKNGKILGMCNDHTGYLRVRLSENGKTGLFLVHRLVAQAFIENPNNYDTVDHINGIKTDNRIENLQWLSRSDNAKRFYKEQISKEQKEHNRKVHKNNIQKAQKFAKNVNSKPVICIETGIIYESTNDAERKLKIYHISDVASGKRKTAKNLHFEYL